MLMSHPDYIEGFFVEIVVVDIDVVIIVNVVVVALLVVTDHIIFSYSHCS